MDDQKAAAAMPVEVWADFVCPFSYMAEHKLRAGIALANVPTDIIYRSFQLRPDLPADTDVDFVTMMANRRNISVAEAREMTSKVASQAATIGLTLRYDRTRATNTRRAHQLAHFARSLGRGEAVIEGLFQAYFNDGRLISDMDTLLDIAAEAGLDPQSAKTALDLRTFEPDVDADVALAARHGISSVPHIVIDGLMVVSGGQPSKIFAEALKDAWAMRQ